MNRTDFMFFFDAKNSNPNGDPGDEGRPRVELETNRGLVTDVCLKRKVRNYISSVKRGVDQYDIYVQQSGNLEDKRREAFEVLGLNPNKIEAPSISKGRDYLCQKFFDIRTFGAVLNQKIANAGAVQGPVQLGIAESIDPVSVQRLLITAPMQSRKHAEDSQEGARTMGTKYIIPYALYRVVGYITPALARETGFTEKDLELLFEALEYMFEGIDRSSSRTGMNSRALILFKHESPRGNAKSFDLFDRVSVKKLSDFPTRNFSDYEIIVDDDNLPSGISIERKF